MIECEVSKIMIDERSHEQMVVLKEKDGERYLPIVIGIAEVSAIRVKFGGPQPPRPISYDLLSSIVVALKGDIDHILVDEYKNGTFFAKLIVHDSHKNEHRIDARPSDSIALAVRVNCPIYVEDHLLELSEQAQK